MAPSFPDTLGLRSLLRFELDGDSKPFLTCLRVAFQNISM